MLTVMKVVTFTTSRGLCAFKDDAEWRTWVEIGREEGVLVFDSWDLSDFESLWVLV